MGNVIGDILVPALVITISPPPVIAVILALLSPRAPRSGPAYAAGWVSGLAVTGAIFLTLATLGGLTDRGDKSTAAWAIHFALGALLLGLAWKQWRGRPKEGEEPKRPKWMQSFETMTPAKIFGVGFLLSGVNPKSVAFTLAAVTSIAEAPLTTAAQAGVLLIFIALASTSVVGLVIWARTAGASAHAKLQGLDVWLTRNNALIMCLLFLFIGVSQVGKVISAVSA